MRRARLELTCENCGSILQSSVLGAAYTVKDKNNEYSIYVCEKCRSFYLLTKELIKGSIDLKFIQLDVIKDTNDLTDDPNLKCVKCSELLHIFSKPVQIDNITYTIYLCENCWTAVYILVETVKEGKKIRKLIKFNEELEV